MRWKFLFIKYRNDVHWWALVFVVKGAVLNLGFCFMDLGIEQIYWVMSALLFYNAICVAFRPWRHVAVNAVDIWTHFCLLMVTSLMTWFSRDGLEEEIKRLDRNLSILLMIYAMLCVPVLIPGMYYMFWQQVTATGKAKKINNIKKFQRAWSGVAPVAADAAKLDRAMNELDEWDFFTVSESTKIILHEVTAMEHSKSGLSTKVIDASKGQAAAPEDLTKPSCWVTSTV